jgi:tetratricopeptide (TPR) repeat protein
MIKKLIPNTIIPEELYVERSADIQLKEIIRDMGRPGYILVARQMGKTNLLINAKRKLEGINDIFAYIDLSNKFDTDRECFRNIIEIILDVNSDKLESISEAIYEKREKRTIAAHREHVNELRLILSEITGKLIINLDEIDSLTAAEYSDKIFAQIRSVYFERVNYSEFERLSYILSGVAEPSDIIKDKSISPFNIGQKILLGDFNFEEFKSLVYKSEIPLSKEIEERIFYWTNGNPRLTWEVCSEVENSIINNKEVNEAAVDKIIKDLYTNNFDRPPIDHIRSLVQSDTELREAVLSIYYNRIDDLSDGIKNKLYLSGILSSEYEFGDIRIKNRIIEESLDMNWLLEINKSSNLSLVKAEELYSSLKYEKASEIYVNIVDNPEFSEIERLNSSYKLGVCFSKLGKNQKAIDSIKEKLFDKVGYRDIYIEQMYILGLSYLKLKKYEEAEEYFNEIIDEKPNEYYFISLISRAAILGKIDLPKYRDEIIELNKEVIEQSLDDNVDTPEATSGAYYNLGTLNEDINIQDSFDYYLKSFDASTNVHKLKPLISAINIKNEEFDNLWPKVLNVISSGDITLDHGLEPYGMELTQNELAGIINLATELKKINELTLFLEGMMNYCLSEKSNFSAILLNISIYLLNSSRTHSSLFILSYIIKLDRIYTSPNDLFNTNKYLLFIDKSNQSASDCFFKGFQNYIDVLDRIDIFLFEIKILSLIDDRDYDMAVKYCDLIINLEGLNSHDVRVQLLTILVLKMRSLQKIEDKLEQALELKSIIDKVKKEDLHLTYINEKTFESLKKEVSSTLVAFTPIPQVIYEGKIYGRNEVVKVKYEDGREQMKKYKLVKDQIKHGHCQIVK